MSATRPRLTAEERRAAVLECACHAMQSDLSLLAVPPDGFFVRVLAHAYDHVIERAIRAGTSNGGFIESRPRPPQSTLPRMVRLQARHAGPSGSGALDER